VAERGGLGRCQSGRPHKLTPVRLFIDTGSVAEVEEIARWGILAGATTNPSLLAKEEGDPGEIIRRICDLVGGPVSAEVVSEEPAGMIAEGRALRDLHEHVTVKVPFSEQGLEATHALTAEGIPVNMTLVFSANQALLAASAGATYVSCFMGRLDDISVDSGAVLGEIVECFRAGGVTSQIIAASVRHPEHVIAAAKLSCEIATVPAKVLRQMLNHPLTDAGAERFREDWESRPEFGEWLRGLTEARAAGKSA
jgi:transaldolase